MTALLIVAPPARRGPGLSVGGLGLKMSWLNAVWQGHSPIALSLGVIVGILTVSIGLSLVYPAP